MGLVDDHGVGHLLHTGKAGRIVAGPLQIGVAKHDKIREIPVEVLQVLV